ncbi:hypothetical protein Cgig2_022549 [Carnegiea gigantea]|uniref:Uncharacterized protein n=1 Tax=Carnegiea gigantea TaxID=171969 RepID=A0A9Q1KLK0_9CARY|nr:hypothetical protein Cgig2_022549 [Carnegiea gigantea]
MSVPRLFDAESFDIVVNEGEEDMSVGSGCISVHGVCVVWGIRIARESHGEEPYEFRHINGPCSANAPPYTGISYSQMLRQITLPTFNLSSSAPHGSFPPPSFHPTYYFYSSNNSSVFMPIMAPRLRQSCNSSILITFMQMLLIMISIENGNSVLFCLINVIVHLCLVSHLFCIPIYCNWEPSFNFVSSELHSIQVKQLS